MKRADRGKTVAINCILIGIFGAVAIFTLLFTKAMVLNNMTEIGEKIVESYSLEEQRNIERYESIIKYGTDQLDQLAMHVGQRGIEKWLPYYFDMIEEVVGSNVVEPYVIIDDRMMNSEQQMYDGVDDYHKTQWYQNAIEADGDIIFSGLYEEENHRHKTISIAKKCKNSSDMIVFNIFPDRFRIFTNEISMPDGSAYYMCDAEGNIIYEQNMLGREDKIGKRNESITTGISFMGSDVGKYWKDLYVFSGRKNSGRTGELYYDMKGENVIVYIKEMQNGWYSVLALPEKFFMEKWYMLRSVYTAVFAFIFAGEIFTVLRGLRAKKRGDYANGTIDILQNAFFSLYKINLNRESYEIIKGSDDVRETISAEGKYQELMDAMCRMVAEEMREEFAKSFSLENIRTQIADGAKDYGGDFLRFFENEKKWFNGWILLGSAQEQDEVILCFRLVDKEKCRRLEQQRLLEESVEKTNESAKKQQTFFSRMSHDMRTPLNIIIGMSEQAEKHVQEPQKTADYLKKIKYAGKQLLTLVNDILDISMLKQTVELDRKIMNIRECAEQCAVVFGEQARAQKKHFEFYPEIEHEMVYSDMPHLNQILHNLISNAIKFTPEGGNITLSVTEKENKERTIYCIRVADTGRGMSEDYLKKLFVEYEREKRFASQSVEGTGLGMPIVKTIVTLMGGTISVNSRLGEGTVFEVELPLETADTALMEEKQQDSTEQIQEDNTRLDGMRILLVEDYDLNRELATEILEECGAETLVAVNGKEGVEKFESAEEGSIDAVLMDMHMPVMDGCEAARHIRALKRPDAQTVPIIALTANAYQKDMERTRKAGMNAHISKPIDVALLCKTLRAEVKKESE